MGALDPGQPAAPASATGPAADTDTDARTPSLRELMPWSVRGMQPGRDWVYAPHPDVLAVRWQRLAGAPPHERAALFRTSRSRGLDSAVAQLPGHRAPSTRLSQAVGDLPPPVRVRYGAFDRLWLVPDHRLLDEARPELWRVADDAQVFAVMQPHDPEQPEPAVTFSAELPGGPRRRGGGAVLPAYRLPGGREPNLAPGLAGHLAERLGHRVPAADVLAWIAAVTGHPGVPRRGDRVPVPLTASPAVWADGVGLGRRVLWLSTYGARCADPAEGREAGPPRMPGGRRPFVRQAVPGTAAGFPESIAYDEDEEGGALLLGEGRIAPVPRSAWEFRAGGSPVLGEWFLRRGRPDERVEPGSLEAVRVTVWPRQWSTELIDLVTVVALLAELHPAQAGLTAAATAGPCVSRAELTEAGVLPAPGWSGRPASVLSHQEDGPAGQFALF